MVRLSLASCVVVAVNWVLTFPDHIVIHFFVSFFLPLLHVKSLEADSELVGRIWQSQHPSGILLRNQHPASISGVLGHHIPWGPKQGLALQDYCLRSQARRGALEYIPGGLHCRLYSYDGMPSISRWIFSAIKLCEYDSSWSQFTASILRNFNDPFSRDLKACRKKEFSPLMVIASRGKFLGMLSYITWWTWDLGTTHSWLFFLPYRKLAVPVCQEAVW